MSALMRLADHLRPVIAEALPEAEITGVSVLPRGARPLAGLGRPLIVTVSRWPVVPPSGVVLAGEPEALATVLGVTVPERPDPSPAAALQRRASDRADDGEGETPPAADPAPAAASGESDEEAPPPARRWTDRAALATAPAASEVAASCIAAVATAVGLPSQVADTQATYTELDSDADAAIGVVPEAISFELRRGESRARLTIVTGVLIGARLAADAHAAGSASGPAAAPAEGAPDPELAPQPQHPALRAIPLPVQARVGRAALPLRSVMSLQAGALLELDAASTAPVELVSGGVTLASGTLQLDDDGLLEFEVAP